jgi:hypothetical protein
MKAISVIFILTIGSLSICAKAQVDDRTKYEMYCEAFNNKSTAPNYIVVIVKNLKTGMMKEICTVAPFIQGAIGHETGNWSANCKKNRRRYFEFAKDIALLNISFDLYSKAELDTFEKTFDVADVIKKVKTGELTNKTFTGSQKEQIMFAHLMFNNGIMMTQGSWAGNICGLKYFHPK